MAKSITLQEYINKLQALADQNPKYKDLPVIYAAFDEGNGYHHLTWDPSLAYAEDINAGYIEEVSTDKQYNCVILN